MENTTSQHSYSFFDELAGKAPTSSFFIFLKICTYIGCRPKEKRAKHLSETAQPIIQKSASRRLGSDDY
jgi:hypothetical protein